MRREAAVYLALLFLTLATYWPVTGYDFVDYDDPLYVSKNAHVQSGLSVENAGWAFTSTESSNWHPLTWLSYMADCQIFGLNAHASHAVNMALHIANSLLLLFVVRKLTGALWRSAFVAALFALHPLHVESVAWVAERKDVLSTLLGLLTVLAYIGYADESEVQGSESEVQSPKSKVQSPKSKGAGDQGPSAFVRLRRDKKSKVKYACVILLFALGLMAKPMLVTLPLLLLLLDFWPLKRFAFQRQQGPTAENQSGLSAGSLIAEKVPLLVLALASSIVTIWVQHLAGSTRSLDVISIGERVANAALGYLLYLGKMFWPAHLAVLYPYKPVPPLEASAAGALLISITWFSLKKARTVPYFFVGWFWFLIMLLPVIGLIQVGDQALADRYSYLPLLGPFVILAWGAVEVASRFEWPRSIVAVSGVALVLACALTTRQQLFYWENSITLFKHALEVTSNNPVAENNLGAALLASGKLDEADEHFKTAIALRPRYAAAQYNSGLLLVKQGKSDEAETQFRLALENDPTDVPAQRALARLLFSKGKYDEAESGLRTVLDSDPDDRDDRQMLGVTLALQKKNDAAQAEFEELIKKAPADPMSHRDLANVYFAEGNAEAAISEYSKALDLCPTNDVIRETLATFLVQNKKTEEASDILRKGLKIAPTTSLYIALAMLEIKMGNPPEAVQVYREALQFKPDAPAILNNLAWVLATNPEEKIRNGKEAVELAEKACKLSQYKQPMMIGTLAAAYAEAGRFPDAVATAQKACEAASAGGMTEVLKKNQELLEIYRGGHAYRETGG